MNDQHHHFMGVALDEARSAAAAGDWAFGAAIVRDGAVVAVGRNAANTSGVPLYHAETTAILNACRDSRRDDLHPVRHAGTLSPLSVGDAGMRHRPLGFGQPPCRPMRSGPGRRRRICGRAPAGAHRTVPRSGNRSEGGGVRMSDATLAGRPVARCPDSGRFDDQHRWIDWPRPPFGQMPACPDNEKGGNAGNGPRRRSKGWELQHGLGRGVISFHCEQFLSTGKLERS
ncbi:MAG: hypothetical protein IH626_17330 [Rhodospirillales bacterium]|nr:hypothetical protein [Rhodospirillales bacterium]